MQKRLEDAVMELAELTASSVKKDVSPLTDKLVFAVCEIAYSVILSNNTKDINERALELDRALTQTKEARYLLNVCIRHRLVSEAFGNRAERSLSSLDSRLTRLIRDPENNAGRLLRRLPPLRTVFRSRRLEVRTFLKADTEALLALFSDPFYKECSLTSFFDADSLYRYLRALPPFYAVKRQGSEELVGAVGIFPDGEGEKRARLECGILPEYRGRGYFSELVESGAEYAFKKLKAEAASIYLPKKRSYLEKTVLRLGFEKEGTLRFYEKDGEDVAVYSIVRE